MKILIYSLNFHPELTGIGKYSGELAEWLAKKNHEVRVITAPRTTQIGKLVMDINHGYGGLND